MTYDQLVTLDTIVKAGSFKAAAEALYKSQPSLSMAIKKLEEELGFAIFNRDQYRPVLTDKGRAFYSKSVVSLESFNQLHTFGKELALGDEAEIRLSIDAIFPIGKLKPVLQSFFAPHIATSLSLSIDILEGSMEKVLNEQVDFAISSYFVESDELESVKVLDVVMVAAIAKEAISERSVEEAITTLPQIIVKSSTSKPSDVMFGVYPRSKRWFTSDISIKKELMLNALGWGRLPSHYIQNEINAGSMVEIKGIPSIHTLSIPIFLLRNKKQLMGPNAKRLWNYLIKELSE